MGTDWKCDIITSPNRLGFEMVIYRYSPDGKMFVLEDFTKEVEIKGQNVFQRTFISVDVMEAIRENFIPKKKREEEVKREGKMDAQSAHLEDMRRLVFKDKYEPKM